MAKGKPRPGRRVGVHRGRCRCSKWGGGHKAWKRLERARRERIKRGDAEGTLEAGVIPESLTLLVPYARVFKVTRLGRD